ncbi:MAG TPA: phosphohydrolase, partial [Spirochaetota bacterium]|nr:phosphohydrolase [Spirochaetota bacterium]
MQIEILRNIEDDILSILKSKPLAVVKTLFADAEIAALQDYSNIVSVDRLLYNDHGAYHMR